jgi:hypothetical protein
MLNSAAENAAKIKLQFATERNCSLRNREIGLQEIKIVYNRVNRVVKTVHNRVVLLTQPVDQQQRNLITQALLE